MLGSKLVKVEEKNRGIEHMETGLGTHHHLGPIMRMFLKTIVVWVITVALIYYFMQPYLTSHDLSILTELLIIVGFANIVATAVVAGSLYLAK